MWLKIAVVLLSGSFTLFLVKRRVECSSDIGASYPVVLYSRSLASIFHVDISCCSLASFSCIVLCRRSLSSSIANSRNYCLRFANVLPISCLIVVSPLLRRRFVLFPLGVGLMFRIAELFNSLMYWNLSVLLLLRMKTLRHQVRLHAGFT